ncbi:MAG: ribonuclease E/G [Pseudomonadota bacterium]
MRGDRITLGTYQGHEVAALEQDGVLQDLLIDSDAPRIGAIYRAKATRPMKGQGGMFFETSDGSAFLRGARGYAPGDMALLQVSGYAEAGKAMPVTDRLLIKGRLAIATADAPGINISRSIRNEEARVRLRECAQVYAEKLGRHGLILRSAAQEAGSDDVMDDIAHVVGTLCVVTEDEGRSVEKLLEGPDVSELAARDWPQVEPVAEDVEAFIDQARRADSALAGGGSLCIEPTRACVAVDVNTGSDTSPAAGLKANLATAQDLPRRLRLMGLGGQVVIDFAPLPKRDRRRVEQALHMAFRADTIETTMLGWTNMGHFELTRKRARPALHEVFR